VVGKASIESDTDGESEPNLKENDDDRVLILEAELADDDMDKDGDDAPPSSSEISLMLKSCSLG
jgi:hypothetical protein